MVDHGGCSSPDAKLILKIAKYSGSGFASGGEGPGTGDSRHVYGSRECSQDSSELHHGGGG